MRLCMFHPNDNPMERGWVGRLDGERVLHLAAQTLQSFFLGGGGSREHAEYALTEVTLLVPVQHPPTVRLFSTDGSFRFANASAVIGPGVPVAGSLLTARARIAAIIGADGAIGGYSALLQWDDPAEQPAAKQSDFGLVLGPTVVTPDEIEPATVVCRLRAEGRQETGLPAPFSWPEAIELAARRTILRPGDVVAGPQVATLDGVTSGAQLDVEGVGTLDCPSGSGS
jgi:Fumarylacetoacetate (FAA) hydrolase family